MNEHDDLVDITKDELDREHDIESDVETANGEASDDTPLATRIGGTKSESGLTVLQEKTISALLTETSVAGAARAVKVGERTIFTWLRIPAFATEYRRCRREAFGQAVALAQRYAPLAVNTLAKILADPDAPQHAKVTAATSLLRFGREGIELEDIADRVEALERAAAESSEFGGRR